MNDKQIEEMIQAKGLTEPRVTPETIEPKIAGEQYYVFPGTTVTVCLLTLENGYGVVGESAAVSAGNFDTDVGRSVARNKARDKIWALEGYLLKERLHGRS